MHARIRDRALGDDRQLRLGRGSSHERPCPVRESDANAIEGGQLPDRLSGDPRSHAFRCREVLRDLADDLGLDLVRASHRESRRLPCLLELVPQVSEGFFGIAIEHLADGDSRQQAIIVAAADRPVEEEMSGPVEPRQRARFPDASLHVRVAGLPILGPHAVPPEHRVGCEEPGRLDVDHDRRIGVECRHVARKHNADLVREDFPAFIVDDAAAVAVAIESEPDVGVRGAHLFADGAQHPEVFRIGVVPGNV